MGKISKQEFSSVLLTEWNNEQFKTKGLLSVLEKGAKGNESNDDTSPFQNSINQSSTDDIWVVVPKGDYKLTAPLILKKGARIIMHKEARLVRYHNDNIFQNGQSGDTKGQDDITILGGKLDLRGHLNKQDGTGVAMGYSKNVWLRDVNVYNVYYSHGFEICAIDTAFIERCGFYGYIIDDAGVRDYAEAIQIERGDSNSFPYFGPGDNTISKNIFVHHCKFGASANAPAWYVAIGSHQSVTVTSADNVEIVGCFGEVPLQKTAITSKSFKNLLIERCTFTAPNGIQLLDTLTSRGNITLRKNRITATAGQAVRIEGIDKTTLDDNVLIGQTNGVMITGSNDVKITESNEISGITSDAVVMIANSTRMKCDGATIKEAGRYAFNVYDGAKHVKILNNFIIKVNGTAVISLAGSGTKNIGFKGNVIEETRVTNVLLSTSGADRVYFNDNYYAASIAAPINSAATNSDTTGNKTF